MNLRLSEMQDRRRRLIKYTFKKEGKSFASHEEFEDLYNETLKKKNQVVQRFSSS